MTKFNIGPGGLGDQTFSFLIQVIHRMRWIWYINSIEFHLFSISFSPAGLKAGPESISEASGCLESRWPRGPFLDLGNKRDWLCQARKPPLEISTLFLLASVTLIYPATFALIVSRCCSLLPAQRFCTSFLWSVVRRKTPQPRPLFWLI